MPEPPGRSLLLEKPKLLARDVHSKAHRIAIQSSKEKELLEYVLSTTDISESYQNENLRCPAAPLMSDLVSPRSDNDFAAGVPIRPGTSSGKRSTTSGSQRPVSRGSTISVSSTSSLLESREVGRIFPTPFDAALLFENVCIDGRFTLLMSLAFVLQLHKQLNVEQIDAILDDLQDALVDERQQLLEDIEFIQV
ncbi:Targeting complex, partial [Globisporangium splendens]